MISRRAAGGRRLQHRHRHPRGRAEYPDKPIKMIVPFPPGGPIDTMARLAGKFITDSVGQQVVVENRPGAGSTIGSKAVAAAAAGRLHADVRLVGLAGGRALALRQRRHRSAQDVCAGRDLRAAAASHGDVGRGAGQDSRRVRRLRQGQSRQGELRRRARHAAASAQHAVFQTRPASMSLTFRTRARRSR